MDVRHDLITWKQRQVAVEEAGQPAHIRLDILAFLYDDAIFALYAMKIHIGRHRLMYN